MHTLQLVRPKNRWEREVIEFEKRFLKYLNVLDKGWESDVPQDERPFPVEMIRLVYAFAGIDLIYSFGLEVKLQVDGDLKRLFREFCEALAYLHCRNEMSEFKATLYRASAKHMDDCYVEKDHMIKLRHNGWRCEARVMHAMRVDMSTKRFRMLDHYVKNFQLLKLWKENDLHFQNSILLKGFTRHVESDICGGLDFVLWRRSHDPHEI